MRPTTRFDKTIAIAIVLGLFYVGHAISSRSTSGSAPTLARAAHAQVLAPSATVDGFDTIITQSTDGRTLYVWTFEKWDQDHIRMPVFRETVEIKE